MFIIIIIINLQTLLLLTFITRDLIDAVGDDHLIMENIVCLGLEQFNRLKDYFDFMFAKKIPSKDRFAYFNNEMNQMLCKR